MIHKKKTASLYVLPLSYFPRDDAFPVASDFGNIQKSTNTKVWERCFVILMSQIGVVFATHRMKQCFVFEFASLADAFRSH